MTTLLDLITKEDSLVKERDKISDKYCSLLHDIDDTEQYPNCYCKSKEEITHMKEEATSLDERAKEIYEELKRTRRSIRVYIGTWFLND